MGERKIDEKQFVVDGLNIIMGCGFGNDMERSQRFMTVQGYRIAFRGTSHVAFLDGFELILKRGWFQDWSDDEVGFSIKSLCMESGYPRLKICKRLQDEVA